MLPKKLCRRMIFISDGVARPLRERATILNNSYLVIDGEMQNIDGVFTVRAKRFEALHVAEEAVPSHDFH
jgi:hypothetical protein